MKKYFSHIHFLKSAASLNDLPADNGAEVAFVGRSNAGKSSALNVIAGIKRLAKVSNTPGRTQLINLFSLDDHRRLVDLPGYGYAKVSEAIKLRWQETLANYLRQRQCLRGLVLMMDCRHPLQTLDQNFLVWSFEANIPVHILLTKADKLSKHIAQNTLRQVQKALPALHPDASLQLFSATTRIGLEEAENKIIQWLEENRVD